MGCGHRVCVDGLRTDKHVVPIVIPDLSACRNAQGERNAKERNSLLQESLEAIYLRTNQALKAELMQKSSNCLRIGGT